MGFGSPEWQPWVLSEEAALPLLEYAYRSGIRAWDTADVYSHGLSERLVAKAIRRYKIPREQLVILSKCYFGVTPEAVSNSYAYCSKNEGDLLNQVGLSRKHILDAVEKSVARLGGYIDVLQIHRLDQVTPRDEIMRALNGVVESGKVRYIGASSMATWEFQNLQNIAEKFGWHKFISMQNYYNLLYREEENEMIPYCDFSGVGLIPWASFARGALTRPWESQDLARSKNYMRGSESYGDEVDKAIITRVEGIANRLGKSMAQVCIAWSLSKGVCPIVGLNKKERIDEAVGAVSIKLTPEDMQYLEEPYLPKRRQGY